MFNMYDFIDNSRTPEGGAGVRVVNGDELMGSGWDSGLRRPYLHTDGKVYVDVYKGHQEKRNEHGEIVYNSQNEPIFEEVREPELVSDRIRKDLPVLPVNNATALTKDAWIRIDSVVQKSVRKRLKAYADLRASNTLGGFDGMSTMILEREIMTDPGEAMADMDGLSEGRNFAPSFALQGIPLPITHADFFLSERFLAVSRRSGMPQDTIRIELAARRVAELIEQTTIGTVSGTDYGVSSDYLQSSKVYGYVNHPANIDKTDCTSASSLNTNIATTGGTTFLTDVLELVEDAADNNYFGPFILYISPAYDNLLDHDFKAESDKTIRSRVLELDKIMAVRRLDYMTDEDRMLLVQMDPDVVQAVNGMEVTTVQWDTKGGMQRNFKVMGIQVPYIRSTYVSGGTTEVTGVVNGTTS